MVAVIAESFVACCPRRADVPVPVPFRAPATNETCRPVPVEPARADRPEEQDPERWDGLS